MFFSQLILCFVLFQNVDLKETNTEKNPEWNLISELNRNFTTPSCGRIVSGEPATFGQKPFQIALFYKNSFICGGSLIGQKHVLTAAHCVIGKQARHFKIHYGTINYEKGIPNFVNDVSIHPSYDPKDNQHDIAMLRLRDTIRLLKNVTNVNTNFQEDFDDSTIKIVQVSGWGRVGPLLPVSNKLLVTNLTIVQREECLVRWKDVPNVTITDGTICAADSGSKSACRGDSGGPLTTDLNGVETLIGIVSLGASNCYSAQLPNIFTNVFHYRDWIASLLN